MVRWTGSEEAPDEPGSGRHEPSSRPWRRWPDLEREDSEDRAGADASDLSPGPRGNTGGGGGYQGPEDFDIDRPSGSDGGGKWLARAGFLAVLLALVGLVAPMLMNVVGSRGGRGSGDAARQVAPKLVPATVTDVIDGNTIAVETGGKTMIVRYLAAATPPVGGRMHDLAAAVNENWVGGKKVLLESDQTDVDSEGRLLRYVYVDGSMVNAALIAAGLARYERREPDTRYADQFALIEHNARLDKRGIWQPAGTGA